jgi:hypothetical protein
MRTLILFTAALLTAANSFAGGFWVEFGNPTASKDPRAKNAAVLVRALGCHNPEVATYTGTAEGLVNGVRKSVPLKFVQLDKKGLWAVERDWPSDGKWVLHVEAHKEGLTAHALAKLEADGVKRVGENYMFKLDKKQLESALE